MANMTSAERMRQGTRKRREQQKQELYHEILSAAAELLLERGYEQFSLRQVAERIGYSAGTIYLYFKDKDEVLFKLAQDFYARFGRQLAAAFNSESEPMARILAGGRAYISFGVHNPVAYQLMFMQFGEFKARIENNAGRPAGPDPFDLLREEVRKGIDAGLIRREDPNAIADALRSCVHGMVAFAIQIHSDDQPRIEAMTEIALQILIDGLKPR
ncbi:TetR/AcrR family transcriptional regulator [Ktedonosporobacter rubrisoli]|uniref:TetR/AcrR family transcriptional regulator n=1 Tax=Ktedonosporobacter rubrisoli TaxID=2509675 RepID=A0A4P6JY70_KTERU|nr:TetR/AcrR family transcriptional regulator [Ktedonosporobacter rubrisoli]QBD80748.1 TetR/AcrR family transcriptional regulator [Ktedonosporobacter rubrisoli]